jgi:hypothetical protein
MRSRSDLYRFYVSNYRAVARAFKHVARQLRAAISLQDDRTTESFTRLLALLLAMKLDCRMHRLLYEHPAFRRLDRTKIRSKRSLFLQWSATLDFAFRHQYEIPSGKLPQRLPHSARARYLTLQDLLKDQLEPILELRNRLAHGQWVYLLNDSQSDVSNTLMAALQNEDIVSLQLKDTLVDTLCATVEDLVLSRPTFERDFDAHFESITTTVRRLGDRNYARYTAAMQAKRQRGKHRRQLQA